MKKIHNIHDLRQEQHFIEQRRLQLEKELGRDWQDIKQSFTGTDSSFFRLVRNHYASTLLVQGLSFGAGLVARRFGGKIGGKILGWLK